MTCGAKPTVVENNAVIHVALGLWPVLGLPARCFSEQTKYGGELMGRRVAALLGGALLVFGGIDQARAEFILGRDSDNPASFLFRGGFMRFNEGEVYETRRAWDNGGMADYSGYLSKYSFEEFGFTDDYPVYAVEFEKQWSFITLRIDASYFNGKANAVAKMHETTSQVPPDRRGYYLGLNDVNYNGKSYDYMFIPDGTPFNSDVDGFLANIKMMVTPVTLKLFDFTRIIPWVHLGLNAGYTKYTVDAGPARGVIQYEVPPEDYVVCGKGTGEAAGILPYIGVGTEVRFTLAELQNGDLDLAAQGCWDFLKWNGSTGDFGFSSKREKDIDLEYNNIEIRLTLEVPMTEMVDLIVGAQYRHYLAEADLTAQNRSEEAQDVLSEKYDKHVKFAITEITGIVGINF